MEHFNDCPQPSLTVMLRCCGCAAGAPPPSLLPSLSCVQSGLTGSLSKVTEEREFLRSLNETLLSNQKEFSSKLAAAQAELKEKDAQLQDLQEQVGGGVPALHCIRPHVYGGGASLVRLLCRLIAPDAPALCVFVCCCCRCET